jgi:hypothetical protein
VSLDAAFHPLWCNANEHTFPNIPSHNDAPPLEKDGQSL